MQDSIFNVRCAASLSVDEQAAGPNKDWPTRPHKFHSVARKPMCPGSKVPTYQTVPKLVPPREQATDEWR